MYHKYLVALKKRIKQEYIFTSEVRLQIKKNRGNVSSIYEHKMYYSEV